MRLCHQIALISLFFVITVHSTFAAQPKLVCSDTVDGPTTGWDGSSTKGAAVSLWGFNFGSTRGTAYVTIGGDDLTDPEDYAEWGATTTPKTARGMRRVTFYLNSSMSLGSTSIVVTNADGTSNSVPFYTRAIGSNSIFFASPTGSDASDGSLSTPWQTGGAIRDNVTAGDVVYLRGGLYDLPDPINTAERVWIRFGPETGRQPSGAANNSIFMSSYPGELATVGNGETSAIAMRSLIYIDGFGGLTTMGYWTISKLRMNPHASSMISNQSADNQSVVSNLRFIGNDIDSSYSSSGTGIGLSFAKCDNINLIANYAHHMGSGDAPDTPTVTQGAATGLTGTYKVKLTYTYDLYTPGTRSYVVNETLPSSESEDIIVSNGSVRVTWGDIDLYQFYQSAPYGYNNVSVWRTKTGGDVFYLDSSADPASVSYVDVSKADNELLQVLDVDGHNDGVAGTYYRGGMFFYFGGYSSGSTGIDIAWNEVEHCYSGSQVYGHHDTDTIDDINIHHNLFFNNERRCVQVGGGDPLGASDYSFVQTARIYNNLIIGNDWGIKINGNSVGDGGTFYLLNNTFYDNFEVEMWAIMDTDTTFVCKNNIFYGDDTPLGAYWNSDQTTDYSGADSDNNIWYNRSAAPIWDVSTLDNDDPLMIDPANGDYTLQLGSPAIGAGEDVEVDDDYFMVDRGVIPDIGAIEYAAGGAPPGTGIITVGTGTKVTVGTGTTFSVGN